MSSPLAFSSTRGEGGPVDRGDITARSLAILPPSRKLRLEIGTCRAASVAGISYVGAVVATDNGEWPREQWKLDRIEAALERGGIKMWELSNVDNSCGCEGAALEIREGV